MGVAFVSLAGLLCLGSATPVSIHATPAGSLTAIEANDNRTPAGQLRGDTLSIELEVRMGTWHPEAESGPAIEVAAFAEAGKTPQIPGPLIRVKEGTTIAATIRNALTDSTIAIFGLLTQAAGLQDSLTLRPGETRQVRFTATAAGTYFYRAVLGKHSPDRHINNEREQVAGALIVDPPGGSPPDRIFVINIWGSRVDSAEYRQIDYRNAMTLNGRSWPYTDRIETSTGDTLHWRVLNLTGRTHPMHLHGFYYQVRSRGDGVTDTIYAAQDRRMVVTEELRPFTTMAMSFVPDRPGNWLFHCHVGFHVVPQSRLEKSPPGGHDEMSHDPMVHMAGLALGITVQPSPGWTAPKQGTPRHMHLFIQEGKRRYRAPRTLGFVLQRNGEPPQPDSTEIPGSILVLTRGQPTDIVVINRLSEPSAIHWHGVELLSYSDGVAGWSGAGQQLAPVIAPGDSFTAHLILPRAGTFIYHTHLNDLEQLSSGLYGAIVVLEPGKRFDPRRDHVFLASWDSMVPEVPRVLINGDSLPAPLELQSGVTHRFRFINIGLALPVGFGIYSDSSTVRWRRVAKDGADLPAHQAVEVKASQSVQVGETYDFEWTPERGEYQLRAGPPGKPFWTQQLIVR